MNFRNRWQKHLQEIKPSYWLLVYRESGTLEIYSLPDLRLSYLIRNFGYGQYVLHDSMESTTLQSNPLNEVPAPEMQVTYYDYFLFSALRKKLYIWLCISLNIYFYRSVKS